MFRISCTGFMLFVTAAYAGAVELPVVREYDDRIVIEYDGSKSPGAPQLPVDEPMQEPPVSYDPPPVLEEPPAPPPMPEQEPPQQPEPPDTGR